MSQFIPLDEVEWKRVQFLERPDETFEYSFELPRPLADWDVFACWERERFHSMRDNLSHGDVLFDVGTEQGWTNLLYARFVGPQNIVLIEPTKEFWPNIKATWERNYISFEMNYNDPPLATYDGLLSNRTTDTRRGLTRWPAPADGPLIDRNKYQYIHANEDNVPEMRLDDLAGMVGTPDAITMDVEGAELLVLQGASRVLADRHPKVWISIHPDLGLRDYGVDPEQVIEFMENLDYTATFLAEDHEQHWYFQ